jgi:hypothetical protein
MSKDFTRYIRIVPLESVFPFEWTRTDDSAGSDVEEPRLFRHPLLVTSLADKSYLLLDNTAEFAAAAEMNLPCLPVQFCREEKVQVSAQSLGLVNFYREDLTRQVARHPELFTVTNSRDDGPPNSIALGFSFTGNENVWAHLRYSSQRGCPTALDNLFRAIISRGTYIPLVERKLPDDAVFRTASLSGTVTMPVFSLDQLRTAAAADMLLPPDIVGVNTSLRILNIDFPLSVLRSNASLQDKESFLRDLILFREQSRRTTLVAGQVYLLNR